MPFRRRLVLGNAEIGGLLFLNGFLLLEVPIFCVWFSLFIFFSCFCFQTSSLLFVVSFLLYFSKISSSVCLFRVSSIPFFFPASDFSENFVEVSLADLGFCCC
ncbi:hypothetical protein Hanom_Chr01g00030241 [Helianthus anomalus]